MQHYFQYHISEKTLLLRAWLDLNKILMDFRTETVDQTRYISLDVWKSAWYNDQLCTHYIIVEGNIVPWP